MEKPNSICAVIPIYNESQFIAEVINRSLKYVDKIILVNDGSTDDFKEKLSPNFSVELINHEKRLGKGAALKSGLEKALDNNFDYIITLDGDLQHEPERIPAFLNALKSYDCVIGNRMKNISEMPKHRRISNFATSFLLSKKLGIKILDSQSGFRAFKKNVISEILPDSLGFEAESEMLIKTAKLGFSIGFVDVPTIYGNEKSKMKSIKAIIGFIKVFLKY
ncbi:MAG: glycosyltransferase family 2 protein [Bacteroidota bacterium]